MAVKLKQNREYKWAVPWQVEGEDAQEMRALFKLPTEDAFNNITVGDKKALLELVFISVDGLEIEDDNGKSITRDALKTVIINDPELSKAFYDAFMEMWLKKSQPEISNALHSNFMQLINSSVASETA